MIDRRAVENIKKELLPNEKVEMTTKQRRLGPGGAILTPTTIMATDRRLILLYKSAFGFKEVYEIIPYNKLTTVRLESGMFSSTIHLHIFGVADQQTAKNGRIEEEFSGLKRREAEAMVHFINGKLSKDTPEKFDSVEDYTYCHKCGARVAPTSIYCPRCGIKLG
jgi:ribosomal protein L40E